MTDREQELINRYIYEVTKRVSKKQRTEIEMELQELIADMIESRTLKDSFDKLGDPAEFAKKYREDKNYIISPEYYDNYMWVLKIVLACVWFGLFTSMVVGCVIRYQDIPYEIANFINSIMVASLTAFGSVTLIFTIMERYKIKVDLKQNKVWAPDMLNQIPDKKAKISRGDCIASVMFIILFSCFMIFGPQFIGAFSIQGDEILYVTVLNMEKWHVILPFVLLSMSVCFIDEMIHLLTGYYCQLVLISSIVANAIQIVLGFIILKVFPFWNADFMQEVAAQFDKTLGWKNQLIERWNTNTISDIILAIIVVASLIEVTTTLYKTLKYGVNC